MARKKTIISKAKSLCEHDIKRWGRTQLIFAGPAIIVVLKALLDNSDELGFGALSVYMLSLFFV